VKLGVAVLLFGMLLGFGCCYNFVGIVMLVLLRVLVGVIAFPFVG